MVILEGCDGTGKTTLAERLSGDLGLRIGLRGTQNRDDLWKVTKGDTYKALAHAVEGYHLPFIWDRLGPFSDPIYAKVLGREDAFNVEELRHCFEIIKVLRCPVIVCHVPLDVAYENAMIGSQMRGVLPNFEQIHALYERMRDLVLEWGHGYVYDYRVPSAYEDIKQHIETYLARRRQREWH